MPLTSRTALPATLAVIAALSTAPPRAAADTTQAAGQLLMNIVGGMVVESLGVDDSAGSTNGTYIPHDSYSAADPVINQGFSPAEGVTCYPKQSQCFSRTGRLDTSWTSVIYPN